VNGIRENIRKLHALADSLELRASQSEGYDDVRVYPKELRVYANIARKIAEEIELEAKNASKT
jgi:hypothetical protein